MATVQFTPTTHQQRKERLSREEHPSGNYGLFRRLYGPSRTGQLFSHRVNDLKENQSDQIPQGSGNSVCDAKKLGKDKKEPCCRWASGTGLLLAGPREHAQRPGICHITKRNSAAEGHTRAGLGATGVQEPSKGLWCQQAAQQWAVAPGARQKLVPRGNASLRPGHCASALASC